MLKRIIRIKPIPPTTINRILVMWKMTYIRNKIVEHSITHNTYKHINQYSADVFNNHKVNKTHNVKKTYYNYNNVVFINEHNTINTNDTYNITKNNSLYNVTDKNYYTNKVF